jgi:cbb3-type cytochrome oxidase maturation protein
MTALIWLIPIALAMGLAALFTFFWAMRSGQFDDMEGAAYRILDDRYDQSPPPPPSGDRPAP